MQIGIETVADRRSACGSRTSQISFSAPPIADLVCRRSSVIVVNFDVDFDVCGVNVDFADVEFIIDFAAVGVAICF